MFTGISPHKYGLKYGTNVPPSVGSWRSPIEKHHGSPRFMAGFFRQKIPLAGRLPGDLPWHRKNMETHGNDTAIQWVG